MTAKPPPKSQEAGVVDDKYNENSPELLRCWAPITTRLLEGRKSADSTSWYVLDNVMEQPVHFVSSLRQELERNGVFKRLSAAQTTGERQTNDILSLLQKNGLLREASPPENPSFIRGDKSTFLGRDLRQQQQFPNRFPHLHSLIQRLEHTAKYFLGHCLEFDFQLTSIQLAEFPGDSISGYPRHCDRNGNLCRQENSSVGGKSERLLTGVYYLTPEDWDQKLDGGCLRLFGEDGDNLQASNSFVDVAPYSNRMILFRSDGVEHEVRPSLRRPRVALTIWLYGRIKTHVQNNTSIEISKSTSTATQQPQETSSTISEISDGPPPLPINVPTPHKETNNHQPTIFVSIAAYRDSETGPTLRNLVAMAAHPERVFAGIVLQLDATNDTAISQALPTNDSWYKSNARCLHMEARHALGPCYARSLCQYLFRGEDYVLQIDSHMRFRKNWDEYLIQELEALAAEQKHDKVMLTAYPVGYRLPNMIPNETRGTLLVPWKFDQNGLLRQRGRLFESNSHKPIPCNLYAAGFNFSRSRVLQDCPYDQTLHDLFFGEELSMAVRLYTKGYDLYAPCESVCYHLWTRDHRPTQSAAPPSNAADVREKEQNKERSISLVKQHLLGKGEFGRHGLGSTRTAQEFADVLGVDFSQGTIMECFASLKQVQFVEESTDFSPTSFEAKVQTLDAGTKNLIAAFLQQVSS